MARNRRVGVQRIDRGKQKERRSRVFNLNQRRSDFSLDENHKGASKGLVSLRVEPVHWELTKHFEHAGFYDDHSLGTYQWGTIKKRNKKLQRSAQKRGRIGQVGLRLNIEGTNARLMVVASGLRPQEGRAYTA